jgi:hypothetical protein
MIPHWYCGWAHVLDRELAHNSNLPRLCSFGERNRCIVVVELISLAFAATANPTFACLPE